MMEILEPKIVGGQAIADYLGITRVHLHRLRTRFAGTPKALPLFDRLVGRPGHRHKEIYSYPSLLRAWWFQYKNL